MCLICNKPVGWQGDLNNCQCDGARCSKCKQILQGLSVNCLCTGAEYPYHPRMIREMMQITFDPAAESEEIQEIFANDIARTLWLGVKQRHRTSQYFNTSCLGFAKIIKKAKKKGTFTSKHLFLILSGALTTASSAIIGSMEQDFAAELLPFVNCERTISFEIKR